MITLQSALNSRIGYALSVCGDQARIISYLNEAQDRLLSMPNNWWGTFQTARFLVNNGCITWPRGVVNIRNAKMCDRPLTMRNLWWDMDGPCSQATYECADCPDCLSLKDDGTIPIGAQTIKSGSVLRFIPTVATDVGKRILVQGYSAAVAVPNNWVYSVDTTVTPNVTVSGEYVTLALTHVDTTTQWATAGITGIQKDATNQAVQVWEYNASIGYLNQLGFIQPDEDIPMYRRSKLCGPTNCSCSCEDMLNITAIVKLGHVPVNAPTDYFVIQNLPALKEAALHVYYEEAGDVARSERSWLMAVRLLNQELRNYTGSVVSVKTDFNGGMSLFNRKYAGFQ